jgi:hypothetical protein
MAAVRTATCRCGALQARCEGEPVRVSVCHCRECQRRTGSAFGVQARWPQEKVAITGEYARWSRTGDSSGVSISGFCPQCGSSVFYTNEGLPGLIAVPVGAFADPDFPAPRHSIWEVRQHPWLAIIGDDVEHMD